MQEIAKWKSARFARRQSRFFSHAILGPEGFQDSVTPGVTARRQLTGNIP